MEKSNVLCVRHRHCLAVVWALFISMSATMPGWAQSAGTLQFTTATQTVGEKVGSVTIRVSRTGGSVGAVSVEFQPSNSNASNCAGSTNATADVDYTDGSGKLDWDDNEAAAKTITLQIADDTDVELDETIVLQLMNPNGGATLGTQSTAGIVIMFDDLPAGAADKDYNPIATGNPTPGANNAVYAVAVLTNGADTGKAVIGGGFTAINARIRNHLARLNANGSVDTNFNASANDSVVAIAIQEDEKVVIGGGFTSVNGKTRNQIARLNADGSLDTTFDPGAGSDGAVSALALQADGKIMVGGGFTSFDGRPLNNIARLNADGSLDDTFDPGAGANSVINAVAVQADGKILAGGDFTVVDGRPRNFIARFNADGAVDAAFFPSANNTVNAISVATNDTVLVGGAFRQINGVNWNSIARLNADGTLDLAFNPGSGTDGMVDCLAVQPDGKLWIAGWFTKFNGVSRQNLARLNEDGTLDTSFMDSYYNRNLGPDNFVSAMGLTPAGNVIIGGGFSHLGGGINATSVLTRFNYAQIPGGSTPGPGNFEFATDAYSIDENVLGGVATISVSRVNGSLGKVALDFTTVDGTALAGRDYTATNGTLIWQDCSVADITFTVPILDNTTVDGNRDLYLVVSNPQCQGVYSTNGPALGFRTVIPLTIVDNDFAHGVLGFSSAAYAVKEDGANAILTVRRTNGNTGPVTVKYAVRSGTAIEGTDFTAATNTLSFAASQTVKTFSIPILDDIVPDGDKTVLLSLFNPTGGAALGLSNSVLTILDNEVPNPVAGTFDPAFDAGQGANDTIYSVTLQPDGKMLIGGAFTKVAGRGRNSIARVNADGTLDTLFDPGTGADAPVYAAAVLADGAVVIGGSFTLVNGVTRNSIARLNADGSVDSSFNPDTTVDSTVYALAVQSDGRIVMGGLFSLVNSASRNFMARLLPSGFLDPAFDSLARANGTVYAVVIQSDGKLVIGGDFTSINSVTRNHLARLNAAGSLDTAFDPGTGPDNTVYALALQTDGKILLGGPFVNVQGTARHHLARLNSDGTLDENFLSVGTGLDDYVNAIAPQSDGRLIIGGGFTSVNGITQNRIARLQADGSLDPAINFGFGANNFVTSVALQTDGKIVIGGGFTWFDDTPRNRLTRVHGGDNPGPGSLEFVSGIYRVYENGTNATITVKRLGGTTGSVSVDFSTSAGTAGVGSDYQDVQGTLAFVEGETSRTFAVPLIDDSVVDGNKTVDLHLANAQGAPDISLGARTDATLVIVDNDSLLNFQAATFSINEKDSEALITLTRTGGTNEPVAVDFTTVDGSATAGLDYTATISTVLFGAGQTSQTVSIPIMDDTDREGYETVQLRLSNPAGSTALGSQPTATLIIVDDDLAPGILSLSAASYSVLEDGGSALITVIRTNGTTGAVSVDGVTSDGTAAAGSDYVAKRITLAFADGETNKTFSIPIIDDSLVEGDETLNLFLSTATGGAILGDQTNAMVTIIDNESALSFGAISYSVTEDGGSASIMVVRSNYLSSAVSVDFATANGTAIAGADYVATNGTLTFDIGETTKRFTVRILDDTAREEDETVNLTLSNPSGAGAALGAFSAATLTILDNDSTPGQLDFTFDPGSGANGAVYTMTLPPADNQVAIGGAFSRVNDVAFGRLARLKSNGLPDASFNIGSGADGPVFAIACQRDGKWIIGGLFNTVSGAVRNRIARLNADGSLDQNFQLPLGFNGSVQSIALQSDGKILVGGSFTSASATDRNYVACLNDNGSLDTGFAPQPGPDAAVFGIAAQPDGKIIIGGSFSKVSGIPRNGYARLNSDGTLDSNFNTGSGANGTVYSLAIQPDGKIILGGDFTEVAGAVRDHIARVSATGVLDPAFANGTGLDNIVRALAIQPNGKVMVAGDFTSVNGLSRNRIARLLADGSPDTRFTVGTGANDTVYALALQPDGKILLAGQFTTFSGVARRGLARLIGDFVPGPLFTSISPATNGFYHLTLTSHPGQVYVLEASANLLDWFSISTNLASTTNLDLIDPNASAFPVRFYRAR